MTTVGNNFFQNAIQGLNFAQSSLNITSNNISNSADVNYTREVPVKVDSTGTGSGTTIVGERQASFYLSQNVWSSQSYASTQSAYSTLANQLNQLLATQSTSSKSSSTPTDIGGALRSFFSSVNALATAPADSSARQSVLSNAGIVVTELSNIGNQIATLGESVSQNISGDVSQINSLSSQIATVNGQLQQYQGGQLSSPPNTLLDQRDALIQRLSKLVEVNVLPQQDGSYSVFMGMGQPLVLGGSAQTLKPIPSNTSPGDMDLAYSGPTGQVAIPSKEIVGGDLGALMQFRSGTLEPTAQSLGNLALSFAASVNKQLSLGLDLGGKAGAPLFALPLLPSTSMKGSGSLSVQLTSPQNTVPSSYNVSYQGNGQYTVTRLSDETSFSASTQAGPSFEVDGLTFTPSGMQAGDRFIAEPYTHTMGGLKVIMTDPTKIAAASGPLKITPADANTGSGTVSIADVSGGTALSLLPSTQSLTLTNTGTVSSPSYQLSYQDALGTTQTTTLSAPTNGVLTLNGSQTGGLAGTQVSLRVDGGIAPGDRFTLSPSSFGTGDVTNSSALYNLQNVDLMAQGQATFNNFYSTLTSNVGLVGSQYNATSSAASGVLSSATNSLQALSGVNLDEEAANLLSEQRQYQAAAKVITVSDQLFQSLLQI